MENNLELENKLNNNLENKIENEQNNFLNTNIGKIANTAIDVGIRFVLPDIIENQVIEVKNSLIEGGIKQAFSTAIEEGINFGKSAIGIITGKFENVEQMQEAVKTGGIIDNISNVIDKIVDKQESKNKISSNIGTMIKNGKNVILDNISANIENMLSDQIKMVNKLEKYSKNWQKYYNNKDIKGMDKEYKKMKEAFNKIVPLETVINNSRKIENLHNLIKNNGNNFDISENEKKLAEIL